MPIERKKKRSSGRNAVGGAKRIKDEGGGSWLGRQLGDLKRVATGAPAAAYQTAKAIDQALPHGGLAEGLLFEREGRHNDPTAIKEQGKAQWEGIKKLADVQEWKEHTALNTLTALGLVAPVAGAPLKAASAAGRASKVPKPRTIMAKPKDRAQAEKWAKARGLDPDKVTERTTFKVEVPSARSATARVAQRGADKVRSKVRPAQRRKVDSQIRWEEDILGRLNEAPQPAFLESMRNLRRGEFNKDKNPRQLLREGNAAARGGILYRPGYIPPNLLGSLATNLIHMGADLPRQTLRERKISRGLNETEKGRMRALQGGGVTQSALDVGPRQQMGPASTFMSGVGESLSKVTDRRARNRALIKEMEDQGYKNIDEIKRLIDPIEVFADPKLRRDLIQVVKRAEPAAIKFSRTSGGNKVDRALAENIFLYKWLTGSARYTGRVAAQHPTLTGALANLPEGEDLSEAMGGVALPGFMQGWIPYGGNSAINPQSLSLWETVPEAAETVRSIKEQGSPLAAIRHLAPIQKAGAQAATGYNPLIGKKMTEYDAGAGKASYSEYARPEFTDNLMFALDELVGMSPYSKVAPRYRSGLYNSSLMEELARLGIGGIMPREINPEVAAFIASAEGRERETPKKKRGRKRKSAGF